MTTVFSILAFIIIIGLVIFIHEFGHFLLAKRNGIAVLEFAIGMGPTLFSRVKNGTKYSIHWIPFGGYCLMYGDSQMVPEMDEEGNEAEIDPSKSFSSKSVWNRMAVILAGPFFNFLLGFLFSLLLVAMIGVATPEVNYVAEGYPAETAGLQAGDVITRLNGEPVHLFTDITMFFSMYDGGSVEVEYERKGEKCKTVLEPVYDAESGRYLLGIGSHGRRENLTVFETAKYGFYEFRYNCLVVIKSLGMFFRGKAGIDDLSGPVGMAGMVNDLVTEVKEDTKEESASVTLYWILVNLINFTALISSNIGMMNLLPIPAMDGGRFLLLLIEAIRGKPLPKKGENIVTMVGFILLLLLMAVVLFNDVRKVFFP